MARTNRYQYETSPRKEEPIYRPSKKKKPNIRTKEKPQEATKSKPSIKSKVKPVLYIIVGFAVLLAISYRNSKINEEFAVVKSMQKELAKIEKENEQLNISIQNDMNLAQVEKAAKEQLGMQKLTSKQTINLSLPKKDYVEPSSEEVVIEENENWIYSIINKIKNIF